MRNHQELSSILIIDDDPAANLYHQIKIEDLGLDARLQICDSGHKALDYIKGKSLFAEFMEIPRPDLILLDLYMDDMNGWDFLEAYKKIAQNDNRKTIVALVSNSNNPSDHEKVKDYPSVKKFIPKNYEGDYIKDLILEHYPNSLS